MRFSRKGISKCASCPLRDRNRVWGEGPDEGPIYQAFLGEAPGEQEDLKRHPFVGPAGGLLSRGLTEASTERFRCWVFNLLPCRPSGNRLDTDEGSEALACCKRGFLEELSFLEARGLRVITPLGGKALPLLGIQTIISKARGSVYEVPGRKFIAVPAYHPAFLLRGMQKEIPTWIADLSKAHQLSLRDYKKPKEIFNLFPSLEELEEFVKDAVHRKALLGVDIETVGLRPDRSRLVVVGLSVDGSHAISVPFLKRGGDSYWKDGSEVEVRTLLQRAFYGCPLVFQNALFDLLHLRSHGFYLRAAEDVLLAHHAVHPELPHNLAYIVSIYGTTPYWKDTLLNRENLILEMEDEELRRYNLRDAAVLHQVLPGLKKDLEITRTSSIYYNCSLPLVEVLASATSKGISIDRKALISWGRSLGRKKRSLEKEILTNLQLPKSFNLDSGDHLRYLIYGSRPPQFARAASELQKYEEPRKTPLRKDTKKYQDLLAIKAVEEETKLLWGSLHGGKRRTGTGKPSVDDQALLSLRLAVIKRKSLVRDFVRKSVDDRTELRLLEKTLFFLAKYQVYSETSKLLSTYTDFPTWKDGKVHSNFIIHGTRTGRLASRDPNLQNIPLEARKVFRSRPGFIFIEGDYSNLEPRILAYLSGDQESIRIFESGKNIHDENTKALFPHMTKDHPKWSLARDAAKKYRLAMNYGGGLYSVYEKVCLEAPELELSFSQFKEADERYREKHPGETAWLQKTKNTAVKKRELRNAFGRIRIFLGTENEVEREGVNFPIQSAAADIINQAMIRIYGRLPEDSLILLQVHDSLLIECRPRDKKSILNIMREEMERKVKLGKKEVVFPVGFKTGKCWGELK